MIGHNVLTMRCRSCWHTETEKLPELHKRLVYIDQFAYSNMAKAIDPIWAADRRPQDPFWTELFDALDRAMKLQLIVCPYSTVHEKESSLSPQPAILRVLYEHLAYGVSLEYPQRILLRQWASALPAWLRGELPDHSALLRESILHGSPDDWMERIRVSATFPNAGVDPNTAREVKKRSHAAMVQLHGRWVSEDKSFEDWYQFERRAGPYNIWELFKGYVALQARSEAGEVPPDLEDLRNPRLEVEVVPYLVRVAQDHGCPSGEGLRLVFEFLHSDVARDVPANDISALLMAGLARKARAGKKKPPSPGMWNDITAIAHFLPYTDAMFVDNECAGLLAEEPLLSRLRNAGYVFCLNSKGDFLDYLHRLELDAGEDHLGRIIRVYGAEWTVPFREILARSRERQSTSD